MIASCKRASAFLCGLALSAALLASVGFSSPQRPVDTTPAFASTCIGYCTYPTNAAKVFLWGTESWRQEFETGRLSKHWLSSDPDAITQQQGMLTIKASSDSGTITVHPEDQSGTEGRWEARVRAVELEKDGEQYRFTWQLVPVGADPCGSQAITLATYVPGDNRVRGSVRALPDHAFTFSRKRDLRSRAWHTYAVEITAKRISWFVDTQVMRTERRPEALSGVEYRPQFVMEAVPGAAMRPSWMQMDWVRAYTLTRPNAQPVKAHRMHDTTVVPDC